MHLQNALVDQITNMLLLPMNTWERTLRTRSKKLWPGLTNQITVVIQFATSCAVDLHQHHFSMLIAIHHKISTVIDCIVISWQNKWMVKCIEYGMYRASVVHSENRRADPIRLSRTSFVLLFPCDHDNQHPHNIISFGFIDTSFHNIIAASDTGCIQYYYQ